MDYKLTVQEHPGYLHVRAEGERTPDNARRALLEAGAACMAKGRRDLLFELDLEGPHLGMLRIYDVIAERSPEGSKLRRIAYVDSVPGKEAKFAETVASNRGVNVRLFADVEAAKRWLSET
jgi:hypothetical protein